VKLVIFDCDGTIVDSQNGIFEAMVHAFSGHGLAAPSRPQTLSVVGLSVPEAFAVLAPEHDEAVRAALAERYRTAFTELKRDPAHHEPLFDGARAVIEGLSAREDVLLGLATGKSRRGIDRLFEREGWGERFTTVQTADDHPSKPHPAMVQAAMADVGAAPERSVMIGDTSFDVQMALDAHIGALGVAWGYHPVEELVEAGAHAVVEDYGQLPQAIDDFFARMETAA